MHLLRGNGRSAGVNEHRVQATIAGPDWHTSCLAMPVAHFAIRLNAQDPPKRMCVRMFSFRVSTSCKLDGL